MSDGGRRHVHSRPLAQPGAPAEIQILPFHEKRLVEAAELEHHLAAHEHRGTVRAYGWGELRRLDQVVEMQSGEILARHPAGADGRARVHDSLTGPVELTRVR